jgi:V8-like Glu-specific endopeptidase
LQVAVNITYPRTLRTVCASNLIEVRFDREVECGESGTACYDKSGRLIGIVMAGTRVADNRGLLRHIAYVQPVHEWFVGRGWEVF